MEEQEIRIGESRYYWGKDNIVHVTIVGEVGDNTATEYRDAGTKFMNMIASSADVLVDLNQAGKFSPKARGVFKELTENEKTGKLAIFGLHPVARVIASFFMGATKKKDMRFFKTKEEALAWLKE